MPIFGGSPLVDFVLLAMPFVVVALINLSLSRKIPVAPTGLIVVGIFCVLTRTVEYRTFEQEGTSAVVIGLLYVVFGAMFLFSRLRGGACGGQGQNRGSKGQG